MNAVRNYQKELEELLNARTKQITETEYPRLLLHSCCAPCSSYVMEYLRQYFALTVFYYNPNISMQEEYQKRVAEQKRLIEAYNRQNEYPEIRFIEGDYDPTVFYEMAKGKEQCPEGGERCFACYELRLRATAQLAAQQGYDFFCTTLSISPLKNAAKLNEIGEQLQAKYGVAWLPSDFKKKSGYQRSIALSAEYDLYRQDYCGCIYSKQERERAKAAKAEKTVAQ